MKVLRLIVLMSLLLGASGCTLPAGGGPTQIPSPTVPGIPTNPGIPAPTDTLPAPAATSTPLPTLVPAATATSPLPTATATNPPPTATATSITVSSMATDMAGQSPFKVRFPAGSTGVELAATIAANETQTYLIRAQQDQTLLAEIFSPDNDLSLALYTEAGQRLTPDDDVLAVTSWRLPSNQEYRLRVSAGSASAAYRLAINIPRVVRFPLGTYGTVETGNVREGETILYRLRADPGYTMTLRLNAPQDSAALGVLGMQSGEQVLAPESGETQWRGVLPPGNTHYLVQVVGLAPGVTGFTLEFDIR